MADTVAERSSGQTSDVLESSSEAGLDLEHRATQEKASNSSGRRLRGGVYCRVFCLTVLYLPESRSN